METKRHGKGYETRFHSQQNTKKGKANYLKVLFRGTTQESYNQCIDKLKCHEISTNEKFKEKQAIKKIPLLFLEFAMNNLGYNRQV